MFIAGLFKFLSVTMRDSVTTKCELVDLLLLACSQMLQNLALQRHEGPAEIHYKYCTYIPGVCTKQEKGSSPMGLMTLQGLPVQSSS